MKKILSWFLLTLVVVTLLIPFFCMPTFAAEDDLVHTSLNPLVFNSVIVAGDMEVPTDDIVGYPSYFFLDGNMTFGDYLFDIFKISVTIFKSKIAIDYYGDAYLQGELVIDDHFIRVYDNEWLVDEFNASYSVNVDELFLRTVYLDSSGITIEDPRNGVDVAADWLESNSNYLTDSAFSFFFAAELKTGDVAQIVGSDGVAKTISGGKGSGDAIYNISSNPSSVDYVPPFVSSDGKRFVIVTLLLNNYNFDGVAHLYSSVNSSLSELPIDTVYLQSSSYDLNCQPEQFWRIYGGDSFGDSSVSIDLYIWFGDVVPDPDDDQYQLGFQNGYHTGFNNGYDTGYDTGINIGFQDGYDAGYLAALEDSDFGGLINSTLTAPINGLRSFILFNGVSLWDVLSAVICLFLLIAFLKLFAGG